MKRAILTGTLVLCVAACGDAGVEGDTITTEDF
jgi:hypothetical protein